MIKALEVPLDINLAAFSQFLRERGLVHRVSEEGLNQVVWVESETEAEIVQTAFHQLQTGELQMPGVTFDTRPSTGERILRVLRRFPLTLVLIVINVLLFPVGMSLDNGEIGPVFESMMFVALEQVGGDWYFSSLAHTYWDQGEWWRLITPMFVHFSWLHVVFNLLWVWEVGRRIEWVNGPLVLIIVVFASSIMANATQYLMSGPGLFGGMSGVVFGLLGHSLVWSRLVPARNMGVTNGIYIFMLAYLAIGFTGAIDLIGLGNLANGAHLGGLIGGLVTGGLAALLYRRRHPSLP